jgi:hypothetical protein
MLTIILGVIWIMLMLYLGSGLWATRYGRCGTPDGPEEPADVATYDGQDGAP